MDRSRWSNGHGGNGKRTLQLFGEIIRQGVKPDVVFFVALLTACSDVGFLEQFQVNVACPRLPPHIVHYGCMVKSMPMEPNDVIWGTLLAACRTHKMSKLHHIQPNGYPSCLLRGPEFMCFFEGERRPQGGGSSSIELHVIRMIHEFTSGHDTSTEKSQTGLMLQEINCRLREAGHVPDLDIVLLDVDEKEKGYLLSRHS
ncbi:hypothetical protein PS2_012316 [Malus domestica]